VITWKDTKINSLRWSFRCDVSPAGRWLGTSGKTIWDCYKPNIPREMLSTFWTQEVLLSTDASGARGSDRKTLELRASGEVSYKGRVFKSGKTRILFAFNHLDSFCIDMTGGFSLRSTFCPKLGLYSRCRSHRAFDMILCQLDSIPLPFWKGLSFITCCFTLMLFHMFIDRIKRGGVALELSCLFSLFLDHISFVVFNRSSGDFVIALMNWGRIRGRLSRFPVVSGNVEECHEDIRQG